MKRVTTNGALSQQSVKSYGFPRFDTRGNSVPKSSDHGDSVPKSPFD